MRTLAPLLLAALVLAGCTAPSQRVPRTPPPAPKSPIVAAPVQHAAPVIADEARIVPLTMEQEWEIAGVRRGS